MRLAMRNRPFLFFSLIMPLFFLFLYCGIFARIFTGGSPQGVRYMFGQVLAITVMGSFWGLSIQLVMFREQGILRRFRLAPVGSGAMLASSLLSNYFLILPTIVIQFLIAKWMLHMDRWGNLWGAWVLVTIGTITFAALGLIVASVTNTTQTTQVVNNVIWSTFLFFSGATLPLPILPAWLQRLSMFLPATYLVTGLQSSMMSAAGPLQLGPAMLSLAGCSALAFVIAQQLFRWEPEAKLPGRAKLWAASTIIPFLLIGAWEMNYGQIRSGARTDFQRLARPAPQQQNPNR